MSTVDITVKVAQETDAVMVEVRNVIAAFVAKKPVNDIIAAEFAGLSKAIGNLSALAPEAKEETMAVVRSVLNRSLDVAEALLAPAPVAPVAPVA